MLLFAIKSNKPGFKFSLTTYYLCDLFGEKIVKLYQENFDKFPT